MQGRTAPRRPATLQSGLIANEFQSDSIQLAAPGYSGLSVQGNLPPGSAALLSNALLRAAIERNRVSFPAQIPRLTRGSQGDLQERIAHLYFVCGWPLRRLRGRYRLSKSKVQSLLNSWRIRAVSSGFVEEIEPEMLTGIVLEREAKKGMEPAAGIEPATSSLQNWRSTN